jgi:serine/threonine protein kinase
MLECGHRLGPYRIERLLEQGGMAAVYLARDTRLERVVAIKVVHRDVSKNAKLRERFEVEARAISGLSHPNICRLFDIGTDSDGEFLVLEYLEGETLSDRLDNGPLPFEDSLRIAIEMADALDHAHRRGILHRDIKPSNIMLTNSGARLMDFGVAKLLRPSTDSGTVSKNRRLPQLTDAGKIVGTYDYMAPEQLEGKEVDARTDIFSLGAVIYEMATRERALKRAVGARSPITSSGDDASLSGKRKTLYPDSFHHIVEVCLAESPEERWQNARDLSNELRWIRGLQTGDTRRKVLMRGRRLAAAIILMILVAGSTIALRPVFHRFHASEPRLINFRITSPPGSSLNVRLTGGMMAVSPDGQRIAFVATQNDITAIWIRSLSDSTPVRLRDTEGAAYPFWSPDSHTIAFFAGGKLKVVDMTNSPVISLCDAPDTRGGSWSKNGTILFSPEFKGGLYAVTLQNTSPRPITHPTTNSFESHRWPSFLPDGNHFLFTVLSSSQPGIYIGALDNPKTTPILPDASKAEYFELGYLLFARDDNLVAQKFDPIQFRLSGEVIRIATGIPVSYGYAAFSSSDNKLIAYRAMGSLQTQMAVCDKNGKVLKMLPLPADKDLNEFKLSPTQDRLAMTLVTGRGGSRGFDVWIYELASGRFFPLTNNGVSGTAIWSRGGTHITFSKRTDGKTDLFEMELADKGLTTLLYHSTEYKVPLAWSHSGKYLVYCVAAGESTVKYMVLTREEPRVPYLLLTTTTTRPQASISISPDDHWIAYSSSESGLKQIYVSPFPGPSESKHQVSVDGGSEPTWDKSGHSIYFLDLRNRMMKVDLRIGKDISASRPEELFRKPPEVSDMQQMPGAVEYMLMLDGPQFVLSTKVFQRPTADLEVLVNYGQAFGGN